MTTPRYTRNLEAARAALAAGFTSASAQQEAVQAVSRAYEELSDGMHSAMQEVDLADRDDAWNELFWSVPDLHQWRAKHTAAIVAAFPGLAATCAQVDELVTLRATIKAAPVVKPVTKKAAVAAKVAAIKQAVAAGVASPIALAIAPLRAEAAANALVYATGIAARAKETLEAAGFDLDLAAPEAARGASKRERKNAAAMRAHLIRFLTIPRGRVSYAWCEESASRYIAGVVSDTEADFDSFVLKLDSKVGAHTAAELVIGATWSYSLLRVTMADGAVQKWQTRCIVNYSALGTMFNQWPTRIVK